MKWVAHPCSLNACLKPKKGSHCRVKFKQRTLEGSVDCQNQSILVDREGFCSPGFGKACICHMPHSLRPDHEEWFVFLLQEERPCEYCFCSWQCPNDCCQMWQCESTQAQATGATTKPGQRVTLFLYLAKRFLYHERMWNMEVILSWKHTSFGIPSFSPHFHLKGSYHPPSLLLQGRKALL